MSHAVTEVLRDIETKRDHIKLRREFYAEVRETLSILDDLENGKIHEARRRYRWLQTTRRHRQE